MEHNTNHVIPWSVVGDLMFARRNDKHFISMDDTDGILFWLTERYNSSLAVERPSNIALISSISSVSFIPIAKLCKLIAEN